MSTNIFFDPAHLTTPNGQVYIKASSDPREWLCLQIQGEIQTTLANAAGSTSDDKSYMWNQELGQYEEIEVDGKIQCTLRVGNLQIIGRKEKLKNPFVVLHKSTDQSKLPIEPINQSESIRLRIDPTTLPPLIPTHRDEPPSLLDVCGVIRYVVRFDKRPVPIVSSLSS